MTIADLKLSIFRQVDTLDKNKLEAFYGLLVNFMNGQRELPEWEKLSANQKQGILNAIDEMKADKGIPSEKVLAKYRRKYSHA